MLTDEQKTHFKTFGFLVLRRVFSAQDIDEIRRESDRLLLENRQGKPFAGTRRQCMIPFFEYSSILRQVLEDDRIYQLGIDLLGPGFVLDAGEGNLHVGDTQWHNTGPEASILPDIKIAIYLESTSRDTGALRLIPGSNHPEFRQHLQPLTAQNADPTLKPFGLSGAEVPCHVFESEPGDIGIFSEYTWHAAFGGAAGRAQHAINFIANPVTDEQIASIRALYEKCKYSLHPVPEMIDSDRPRLRGMVAKLVELGFGPPAATGPFE